jgi:hypothetical protein
MPTALIIGVVGRSNTLSFVPLSSGKASGKRDREAALRTVFPAS